MGSPDLNVTMFDMHPQSLQWVCCLAMDPMESVREMVQRRGLIAGKTSVTGGIVLAAVPAQGTVGGRPEVEVSRGTVGRKWKFAGWRWAGWTMRCAVGSLQVVMADAEIKVHLAKTPELSKFPHTELRSCVKVEVAVLGFGP